MGAWRSRAGSRIHSAVARVLVVDDELDIREAVTEVLSYEGHEVFTAAEGEQGLVRCRQVRPDLVLLDVSMPELARLPNPVLVDCTPDDPGFDLESLASACGTASSPRPGTPAPRAGP